MDDYEDLVSELRAGANSRGLLIIEALFPGEPTVVFQQETTSIEELLDLAQRTSAPFVSLTVTRLDPSELIESWDPEDDANPGPPAALLGRWQKRAEQIDGIFVQWIASGAVYLYLAVPDWKQELEELRQSWSDDQDAQSNDLDRTIRIRMAHLAEQLEREPEYRSGTSQTRGPIGKALLEPMLQSNEGGYTTTLILREASRLVRDNAQGEYSKLMGRMDELAGLLRSSEAWQRVHTTKDRTVAARNFLIKESGGYSPSGAMIDEMRRLTEKTS